ncbi:hypothetical protein B0H21DRAFT_737437 [Amylocystis lapponica]|nr:hypothetical protein B0H21DRAFT_737437 [Amylocystis lapponica]
MVAYMWLVWYAAPDKTSCRHWALAVTYEADEHAYATIHEVALSDAAGQFLPKVVRRVHLTRDHLQPYAGKMLLGEIVDSVLSALELYSETAVELINAQNQKRGSQSNCQDWAIIIIRSLEDALLLPQGTLARVEKCPRSG